MCAGHSCMQLLAIAARDRCNVLSQVHCRHSNISLRGLGTRHAGFALPKHSNVPANMIDR